MVRKELLTQEQLKPLSKKMFDKLTIPNLMVRLMEIFKDHIGHKKWISKNDLFKEIFKRYPQDSLEDWVRWQYVKQAMHRCRTRTKCFISSKYYDDTRTWNYFVVKTEVDAQAYINTLERSIKKMRFMQKHVMKSVKERWHSQKWELPPSYYRDVPSLPK